MNARWGSNLNSEESPVVEMSLRCSPKFLQSNEHSRYQHMHTYVEREEVEAYKLAFLCGERFRSYT